MKMEILPLHFSSLSIWGLLTATTVEEGAVLCCGSMSVKLEKHHAVSKQIEWTSSES